VEGFGDPALGEHGDEVVGHAEIKKGNWHEYSWPPPVRGSLLLIGLMHSLERAHRQRCREAAIRGTSAARGSCAAITSSPVERMSAHLDPAGAEQMQDSRQRAGQENTSVTGRRLDPDEYSPTAKQFRVPPQEMPLKPL